MSGTPERLADERERLVPRVEEAFRQLAAHCSEWGEWDAARDAEADGKRAAELLRAAPPPAEPYVWALEARPASSMPIVPVVRSTEAAPPPQQTEPYLIGYATMDALKLADIFGVTSDDKIEEAATYIKALVNRFAPPPPALEPGQRIDAETLTLALRKAGLWFRDYERRHVEKGDEEKAARNRERADYCERTANKCGTPERIIHGATGEGERDGEPSQQNDGWRPIKSAPKGAGLGKAGPMVLLWAPHWKEVASGWYINGRWVDNSSGGSYHPTMWRPMPPAPREQSGEEKASGDR